MVTTAERAVIAKEVENNPSLLKQYRKMIDERDVIVNKIHDSKAYMID